MTISLGRIIASDFSRRAPAEADRDVEQILARHAHGDWGKVDATGEAHNDFAAHDLDVTSYFRLASGVIIAITTEFDRSLTHVELFSGNEHVSRAMR
jgi:hypothetical protein